MGSGMGGTIKLDQVPLKSVSFFSTIQVDGTQLLPTTTNWNTFKLLKSNFSIRSDLQRTAKSKLYPSSDCVQFHSLTIIGIIPINVIMSSLTEQHPTGSSVIANGNKSRVYTIDDILGRRSSNVEPIVPAKLIGMNLFRNYITTTKANCSSVFKTPYAFRSLNLYFFKF